METKSISIEQKKEENKYGNEISNILSIKKNIIETIEENSEHMIEKKTGKTKRIILDSFLTNEILKLFGKNQTDKTKDLIKSFLKKHFLLKNKDIILFSKGNIYIILASNDKRFNGFDEENINFILHDFLKDFNQNDILYKVIQNINLKKYSKIELKKFIENNLNQTILNKYTLVIQELLHQINQDIDIKIIDGIAGKLLRDNYEKLLYKLSEYFLKNFLEINDIKEEIINLFSKKINFNKKTIDFLKLNENLERNIKTELVHVIEKKNWETIGIKFNNIITNFMSDILYKEIFYAIISNVSSNIINTISKNYTNYNIIKNIESFLSYYSGKIIISYNGNTNIKLQYPELNIKGINQIKSYINNISDNNYKVILNKLTGIIANKARLEKDLNYLQKNFKKIKGENSKKKEIIKKYRDTINLLKYNIDNIKNEKYKTEQEIKKLTNQLKELNSTLSEKFINTIVGGGKIIKNKIKYKKNKIKNLNKNLGELSSEKKTLEQRIKFLEQNNPSEILNKKIKILTDNLETYNKKLLLIEQSMEIELRKRKRKINF